MRHSHAHGEDLINIASRPKGLRDASTGKRPQLPTVRHLPPRRQAIGHAWDNGLITDEELRLRHDFLNENLRFFSCELPGVSLHWALHQETDSRVRSNLPSPGKVETRKRMRP